MEDDAEPGPEDVRREARAPDRPEPEGDAVCWLERVCDACGGLADGPPGPVCGRCGARLEGS